MEPEIKEVWKDAPCGKILERQYWLNGVKVRQDIEVHVDPALFTMYDGTKFRELMGKQMRLVPIGTKEPA